MDIPQHFADAKEAQEIARASYPDAESITMIESYDNIVALIDTDYAMRFPRNKAAYLRSIYEKHILKQLENADTVTIPHVLDEHADPPYTITSFVPGHHISSVDIRSFSEDEQQAFAKAVAQFAYTMHTAFTLDDELPLRKMLGLDELEGEEPWPIYFKRTVHDVSFPTVLQSQLARKYYSEWVRLCDIAPTIVVHDDLHTLNMMFEGNKLIGVLDFGDTNVGTPEQELRQMYRINGEVALTALREYEHLSGRPLSLEALKLWAITQELAVYTKALVANTTDHHTFKRACRNLNDWLGGGDWGEGYDISIGETSQ